MRLILLVAACCAVPALCQAPQEIVRRSVELDQVNWLRRADYTWLAESRERHLDAQNHVTSEHQEAWETIVLDAQPYRRTLERDYKPLPATEQRKEQEKLDKAAARLERETPEEKQRRSTEYEKARRRQRAFLLEIPDAYDSGWQATRKSMARTETISFGWFLARLNPGAKLVFEQSHINDEVWLPKREFLRGSGRIGLLKRVAEDQEITWTNYRKFRVESKIVSGGP